MPRKVNYELDYDDGYDDDYDTYEEYDDDEHDYDKNDKAGVVSQEIGKPKPGVWRCSICTYDNDEAMNYCDICGVIKVSTANSISGSGSSKNAVGGICKCKDGASVLAKSLFAPLLCSAPKKDIIFRRQNDFVVTKEGNRYYESGPSGGDFHEFHRASDLCTFIVPFKFDVPSPDDVVASRLIPSKKTAKDASSSILERNTGMKSQSGMRSVDNVAQLKGKHGNMGNGSSANNGEVAIEFSDAMENDQAFKDSSDPIRQERKTTHDSQKEAVSAAKAGQLEGAVSSLSITSANVKPGSSKQVITGRTNSRANYRPDKWMLPEEGEEGQMRQLNLAIVGHVDSGKSTLSGRLLHLLGKISKKDMHKFEKEAKLQGKGSFAYAWALDESAEERERGITMTVAVAYFDTKRYHVVVLDSPGHKDFVPNMISGATQADAGILVIDASIGSFEAGIDSSGGQTREHAQLIRSFGVEQIIVAVNKMDAVGYSKERFELIKKQVGSFLRSCNFKDSHVSWVPLSAMENQNLVVRASDVRLKSWYQGPDLIGAIDSFLPPTRNYSKPLLMPICDVIKSHSMGQVSACGKLEFGAVRNGSKVLVMPSGNLATVKAIECNSQPCHIARSGDNVAVSLQGIDSGHVNAGGVLCHPDFPVRVATRLELKILVLDVVTMPILIGSQVELHVHHAKEAARVVKIVSLLDSKTGKVTKKAPRCILAKQGAVLEVSIQAAVCVEEFTNSKALGRAFLRASGRTIAVGVITRIIEDQE